jgi:hemolysin activation/secretion protein
MELPFSVFALDLETVTSNDSFVLAQQKTENTVNDFEITIKGNTVYSDETLRNLDGVNEAEGLQEIAQIITNYYLSQGYITSTAKVVQIDGKEIIEVQERGLDGIWIEGIDKQGNPRISRLSNYICRRINLGVNQPFRTTDLESQLRLLQLDPLIANIEGTLRSKQDHQSLIEQNKESKECFPEENRDNKTETIEESPQGTILVVTVLLSLFSSGKHSLDSLFCSISD